MSFAVNTGSVGTKPARGMWRNGQFLMLYLPDHEFPPRCLWSGVTANVQSQKQQFLCGPPGPAVPSLALAVADAMSDAKHLEPITVELSVPVSKSYHDAVDAQNVIVTNVLRLGAPLMIVAGIVFLFGLTPLGDPATFGWQRTGHTQMCWTLIILGTVLFGFGLAWPRLSQHQKDSPKPLPAVRLRNDYIAINGASGDFLAHLPDWKTVSEKANAGW